MSAMRAFMPASQVALRPVADLKRSSARRCASEWSRIDGTPWNASWCRGVAPLGLPGMKARMPTSTDRPPFTRATISPSTSVPAEEAPASFSRVRSCFGHAVRDERLGAVAVDIDGDARTRERVGRQLSARQGVAFGTDRDDGGVGAQGFDGGGVNAALF